MKQSVIRREKNRHVKRTLRTQCRKVREAVAAGDVPKADTELRQAAKLLDRAGARHVIHRNAAGRTKSGSRPPSRPSSRPSRPPDGRPRAGASPVGYASA